MPRFIKLALPALILLFLSAHLTAQDEPKWESHGPYGGLIWTIQVDKSDTSRMLIWTTGGNFLSTNAGSTWKRLSPPEGSPTEMRATLIGSKIYCWCKETVFASDDGKAWEKTPLRASRILYMTCQPGKPEIVWNLCTITWGGNGKRWLCAKRWEREKRHIWEHNITDMPEGQWYYLIVSPVDPKVVRVFVLQYNPTSKTLVYGSDDGGKTWEHWTLDFLVFSHTFSSTDSKTVYACAQKQPGKLSGFIKSRDGGKTWEQVSANEKIGSMRTVLFQREKGHLLLGTLDKGLFKTTDFGKTLTERNKGLYNENVSALAADPTDENILYTGTQSGLYKSTDGGKSWICISKGIEACQATGLVAFEHEPETICFFEYHQGTRISKDGGRTWSPAGGMAKLPGKVWNVWCRGKTVLLQASGKKLTALSSKDMCKTWTECKGLGEKDYVVAVVSDDKMFAVHEKLYFYKSGDGVSWKPFAGPFNEVGNAIWWVDGPREGNYVLVVGDKGIAKCDASTGKRLGSVKVPEGLLPFPYARAFDPSVPGVFYVGDTKGMLHKCNLNSQEWVKIYAHPKQKEEHHIISILFDPGIKDRMIIGFGDGHIAFSEDSGKTWKPLKPELPFFNIRGMAVTAKRKLFVVGNGTLYTLDLSKIK